MECPYCKKEDCVQFRVYGHAERYMPTGGRTYYDRCKHCDKVLRLQVRKTVEIIDIEKSTETKGEWG